MTFARTWLLGCAAAACFVSLPPRVACAYQPSDLQGIWETNAIASGPGAPWWQRSHAVVASDGSFTAFSIDNSGDADTLQSQFNLTSMGILTVVGLDDDASRGALDTGKSVFAATGTWGTGAPGTTELRVGLKMAPSYSLADLAGDWELNILASGPGAPWWERGRVTIASNGNFSGNMTDNAGQADATSGSFALTPAGILTFAGSPTGRGALDIHKTVLCMTSTWTGYQTGTVDFAVGLKMAPSYTLTDLAGAWEVYGLATGPGAPRWSRNHVLVRNDGSFVSYYVENDGQPDLSSGTLSISPAGVVTRAGALNARGALDAGKSVMVWTDTWTTEAPGTSVLEIAVKISNTTVDVPPAVASGLALAPVYPNPARSGAVTVHFDLPDAGSAQLELLDVSGRRLTRLEVGGLGAGRHARNLGAERRLAPGLYLVRLTQGGQSRTQRVVLLD